MKFYFDKNDGTTKELNYEEVREHLSHYQVDEAIEAKKADPLECVSYMTVGGSIRVELDKTEANKMKRYTCYILGNDFNGTQCETCFTVSVADNVSEWKRNDLIRRAAPIMAKLQGLTGTDVEIEFIEEDTSNA